MKNKSAAPYSPKERKSATNNTMQSSTNFYRKIPDCIINCSKPETNANNGANKTDNSQQKSTIKVDFAL